MKNTYKLNKKILKALIRVNRSFFVLMILFAPVMAYIKGVENFKVDSTFLFVSLGVILVFNIPTIWLLIDYYVQNKKTSLVIDNATKMITIRQSEMIKTYQFNDIVSSTYNIGIYYKNAIDNNRRWAAIHSDLGYWDLKFRNGDRYYLSNLLVDFLHDTAFIKNTKYRFRLFPYIDKSDSKKGIELKRRQEKSRVEKFVDQFQIKSERQLKEIIENRSKYQKEAVMAAEILLNNKNVG